MDVFSGFLIGVVVAAVAGLGLYLWRRGRSGTSASRISVHATIEQLRAIGHLSAFKVITKEIVTETDHSWGSFGARYLRWVLSDKRMAMIFEFGIDFRYDLRRSDFEIVSEGLHAYRIYMPPCLYEVSIRDIRFYDEQRARLLPWLLPDLLNGFLMDGFSQEHRNRLLAAAKGHAEKQARDLIASYEAEVQRSAEATLRSLSAAFGAEQVSFEFRTPETYELNVEYEAATGA